jgi:hypothetical protein
VELKEELQTEYNEKAILILSWWSILFLWLPWCNDSNPIRSCGCNRVICLEVCYHRCKLIARASSSSLWIRPYFVCSVLMKSMLVPPSELMTPNVLSNFLGCILEIFSESVCLPFVEYDISTVIWILAFYYMD